MNKILTYLAISLASTSLIAQDWKNVLIPADPGINAYCITSNSKVIHPVKVP